MNVFKFLDKGLFSLNLKNYPNLGIDFEINKFLLIMALALCCCFFFINWRRGCMYLAVKQLTRHECVDQNSAKTLVELGLISNLGIKLDLSREGALTKIVRRVGEVKYTYEQYQEMLKDKRFKNTKFNFEEERFYLDPEEKDRAKNVFDNYAPSLLKTALLCLLILVLFYILMICMPEILSVINDSFSSGT